jgi:hypothetical protein
MRRRLGLPRRLADTTARDALCRVPLDGLRAVLHRAVRAAWRRKALAPVGLPMSVVALDGKATALPCINGEFAQTQHPEQGIEGESYRRREAEISKEATANRRRKKRS